LSIKQPFELLTLITSLETIADGLNPLGEEQAAITGELQGETGSFVGLVVGEI
jgi:hypothetical protein